MSSNITNADLLCDCYSTILDPPEEKGNKKN